MLLYMDPLFIRGLRPPIPLTRSLAGPQGPAPLAWLARPRSLAAKSVHKLSRTSCCRLPRLAAEPLGPRTPPYPTNHGQLDDEDEERRLDHRADDRWNVFRLEVDGVPQRQPSPVATL